MIKFIDYDHNVFQKLEPNEEMVARNNNENQIIPEENLSNETLMQLINSHLLNDNTDDDNDNNNTI